MQTPATLTQNNLSVFLLGAILHMLAALDFTSLIDYSIKAFVVGIIWLLFKLIGDWMSLKIEAWRKAKNKEGKHET